MGYEMMKGIFSCRRIRAEANRGSIALLAVSSLWDLQELQYRLLAGSASAQIFSVPSVFFVLFRVSVLFLQCFSVKKGGINA